MTKGRRERGEGTIFYVESRKRWAVEFTLADGKKPRKFFLTEKDAKKYAKDTAAKMRFGVQPAPASPTLDRYMTEWLETVIKPNRAESTYTQYKMMATRHILPAIGKLHVSEIQRSHVQKLINDVASKRRRWPIRNGESRESAIPISRNTVRIIKSVLSSCLNMAVGDGLAIQFRADLVELPPTKTQPAKSLTPAEAIKLLRALEETPVDSLIAFLLLTGCRLAEGHGLRWKDVNDGFDTVLIAGQLKRESDGLKYSSTTKTHRARMIALSPQVSERLRALKAFQIDRGHSDPDDLVFLSVLGARFDPKTVRARLSKLCRSLGLPHIKVHELRHTAATLMAQLTGDIHAVQKVLGHSQVSLTANLYAHGTDQVTRSALNQLGDFLEGK